MAELPLISVCDILLGAGLWVDRCIYSFDVDRGNEHILCFVLLNFGCIIEDIDFNEERRNIEHPDTLLIIDEQTL